MTFDPPEMHLRYGSGAEATAEVREQHRLERQGVPSIPTYAQVTAKYPVLKGATSAFAAGSVVQGWAHATSDLDLYVVFDGTIDVDDTIEFFERRISTGDPLIRIMLGEFGAFRADIEIWRTVQVDELIARFSGDTPDQEAPELEKFEQDLLHRLSSGRPIEGTSWWTTRRDRIRASSYGTWLAENRKLTAESYLEDVAGLLISKDPQTAVMAAHEAFVLSLEAVLAVNGDYALNRKWLYRRMVTFRPNGIDPSAAWNRLVMTGAGEDPLGWAQQTAATTQQLLLAVEEGT